MFANMNPHLRRHHEIAIGVLKQTSEFSAHLAAWAERASTDIEGNYPSPCGGKAGKDAFEALVDALRRVLVLEVESGKLPKDKAESAKREALYVALHDYFGVNARASG